MAFGKSSGDEKNTGSTTTTSSYNPPPSQSPTPSTGGSLGAFLGTGSKVIGQLVFTGPVELDGQIEGEVSSQDKLTIGESAFVKGTINGTEILVKGTIQGDVIASKKLILRKPAKIVGNISAPSLNIEEGVTFDGKCTMNTGASAGMNKSQTKPTTPGTSTESAGKSAIM